MLDRARHQPDDLDAGLAGAGAQDGDLAAEEGHAEPEPRLMGRSMMRGFRMRCPSCGSGPMLRNFLKVRDTCPVCGEAFHHHRADDGPPYLTLLIVGHIIGPAMLWTFMAWEPEPFTFMAIFMVASVALSLWFLPRLKGMIVGVQWAARMHGFGRGDAADDLRD